MNEVDQMFLLSLWKGKPTIIVRVGTISKGSGEGIGLVHCVHNPMPFLLSRLVFV